MAVDARGEVIAAYRARRTLLLHEATDAATKRRPITARLKREAASILSRAISDEILDQRPTGIGTFDEVEP